MTRQIRVYQSADLWWAARCGCGWYDKLTWKHKEMAREMGFRHRDFVHAGVHVETNTQ